MSDINIEYFIGPWVLPNEEIPVYIIWDRDFEFSNIKIEKPSDLVLVKLINIEEYDNEEEFVTIHKGRVKNPFHKSKI